MSVLAVVKAVLTGLDCWIYTIGGLVFTAAGVFLLDQQTGLIAGVVALILGLGLLAFVGWRIWYLYQALKTGSLVTGTVIGAEVRRIRWYGTPWGDLINGTAARGEYRLDKTGVIRRYYLQERWATRLQEGARLAIIERDGKPALVVPECKPNQIFRSGPMPA